jgi:hypothetical protein
MKNMPQGGFEPKLKKQKLIIFKLDYIKKGKE